MSSSKDNPCTVFMAMRSEDVKLEFDTMTQNYKRAEQDMRIFIRKIEMLESELKSSQTHSSVIKEEHERVLKENTELTAKIMQVQREKGINERAGLNKVEVIALHEKLLDNKKCDIENIKSHKTITGDMEMDALLKHEYNYLINECLIKFKDNLIVQLTDENTKLENSVNGKNAEIMILSAENTKLVQTNNDLKNTIEHFQAIQEQNKLLTENLALRQAIQKLVGDDDKVKELEKENAALKTSVVVLQNYVDRLKITVNTLYGMMNSVEKS